MKPKYLIWIAFFCLFFSGCGKQETETNVQKAQGGYVAHACEVPDLQGTINSTLLIGSKLYAGVYTKGTAVEDGRYSVVIYDISDGTTERTILQGREEMAMWSFTVLEDGNYKALFLVWSSEELDYTSLCLATFDREGNLVEEQDIRQKVKDQVQDTVPLGNFYLDRTGILYFYDSIYSVTSITSKIYSVQNNGEIQFIKEYPDSIWGLQIVSSHMWIARNPEPNKIIIEEISNRGAESKEVAVLDLSINSLSTSMSAGLADEQIFIAQDESVYEYDLASKRLEKLFDYDDVGLAHGEISNTCKLIATAQDEFYVIKKTAETEEGKRTYDWLKITRSDEVPQKEILTIAVAEESSWLKEAVTAFNKSSDQYKVVVKVYETDGVNKTSDLLQAEIAAGNVPDMIAVGAIDMDAMLHKGLLHDLSDLLERDPDLSKNDFVGRALEIYKRNDKLYAIPQCVFITALTGKQKMLEGRESWDMQEFKEFINGLPNEETVFWGISRSQMLQFVMEQHLFSFVDWESRTCSFESEEFKELLEFIRVFSDENPNMEDDMALLTDLLRTDEIVLYPGVICNTFDYQFLKALWGEEIAYIGFPSAEGTGIRLGDIADAYAIMEGSAHKEEMWQIIKYMVMNQRLAQSGLPAYQPLFDKACENAMEKKMVQSGDDTLTEEPRLDMELSGIKITIYAATAEEVALIRHLLEKAEPVKMSSPVIMNIIQEEVWGYFYGQKSVDDVARVIQNKVSLYLSE